MDGWTASLLLFAVGLVAATANVVAGGGSFLTLPVLLFLGLPATVANATNRVGVVTQTVTSAVAFHGYGLLPRHLVWRASLPAAAGAFFGAWAALQVGDLAFRRLLAVCMLALTLLTFWRRTPAPADPTGTPSTPAWLAPAFFGVGLYGGFIQAGVGFLVLAITNVLRIDLVRANALKNTVVLPLTVIALGLFASRGAIDWTLGLALAAGNMVGGLLGVRLALAAGHRWLQHFVTVTMRHPGDRAARGRMRTGLRAQGSGLKAHARGLESRDSRLAGPGLRRGGSTSRHSSMLIARCRVYRCAWPMSAIRSSGQTRIGRSLPPIAR